MVDARWTTALTEHWYRVWTGAESIRELPFFFPQGRTIGISDPFLVQGQLHAVARALGAGLLESWLLAQVVTFLAGAIGVAVLSRLLLRTVWAQVAFVVVACTSYPLALQIAHPQTFMFLWLSWLAVGIHEVWTRPSPGRARRGLVLLLVLPPLIAMSGFYALALGLLVVVILVVWRAVVSGGRTLRPAVAARLRGGRDDLRSPAVLVAVVIAGALWAFAAWLFLPGRSVLPDYAWSDVLPFAPRWSDVIDAREGDGGGIWLDLYGVLFEPNTTSNVETRLGFTPLLLVSAMVVGVALVVASVRRTPSGATAAARWSLAGWLTLLTTIVLLVTYDNGFSLYEWIWTYVPGFEAVRAPFRVQLILYPLAAVIVLRWIEDRAQPAGAISRRRRVLVGTAGCALAAGIVVEMYRPPYFDWDRREVLNAELFIQVDDIAARCDAFVLVDPPPGTPSWLQAIDAVLLATLSGVPTPQGYSRDVPLGHPGYDADAAALVRWMRAQGFTGDTCVVSRNGIEEVV